MSKTTWESVNKEIFQEYLEAGDTFGMEITIKDAKDYGLDTSEMEQTLRDYKNTDNKYV